MTPNCPDPIIRATLTAVHRRDHVHTADCCHPHDVEVVHLGHVAMTVCHDCSYEFGFDDTHTCEREAKRPPLCYCVVQLRSYRGASLDPQRGTSVRR